MLCLECVHQKFQPALDQFSEKKFDIDELRKKIQYDDHWPFPWDNYKELFVFANENNIPLLALNSGENSEKERLIERDLASAQIS